MHVAAYLPLIYFRHELKIHLVILSSIQNQEKENDRVNGRKCKLQKTQYMFLVRWTMKANWHYKWRVIIAFPSFLSAASVAPANWHKTQACTHMRNVLVRPLAQAELYANRWQRPRQTYLEQGDCQDASLQYQNWLFGRTFSSLSAAKPGLSPAQYAVYNTSMYMLRVNFRLDLGTFAFEEVSHWRWVRTGGA